MESICPVLSEMSEKDMERGGMTMIEFEITKFYSASYCDYCGEKIEPLEEVVVIRAFTNHDRFLRFHRKCFKKFIKQMDRKVSKWK